MESKIAKSLKLKYGPVVVLWSNEKPENALQFTPGRWGCVMGAFAAVAEKGRPAVFDKDSYGCWGGGVGLGFGDCYQVFPGGIDCFNAFLSDGNGKTPKGLAVAEACSQWMTGSMREEFLHGERYRKSPQHVQGFVDRLPIMQVPSKYVVFKQLSQTGEAENIASVVFITNADQMSALVVLANFDRSDVEGALIPHAAGCQSIGILTYEQSRSADPRAVVGLNDPSARKIVRKLGKEMLTVSVPLKLFQQMEANVEGSFLEKKPWTDLASQEP